jgi:hypothetical protein
MSNITPHNDKPNYYKNYARAVLTRRFDGVRLRFDKGAWLHGETGVLFDGHELVALMSTLKVGWIKWFQGEVSGHALGLVSEGFVPPRREELDDLDPTTWESDSNTGKPKDPWVNTNELVMIDPKTREIYTFTTSTRGGFQAIAGLAENYGDGELLFYPQIGLRGSSYQHKNRAFGRVHVPVFEVLKLVDAEKYDAILAASRGGMAPAPAAIEGPKPDGAGGGAYADDDLSPRRNDGDPGPGGNDNEYPANCGGPGAIDDDIPF